MVRHIVRDSGSTRVDRLHCKHVDAPGTASGIPSLNRPQAHYGCSGAGTCLQAPRGTFIRRLPSEPQPIIAARPRSTSWQIDRRCRNAHVHDHQRRLQDV
ncbi:hypothetical protein XAC3810_100057 [Xanthomonas citri pv. citri]|uniref:Uncharacterized protein n=1 Tax=Xanthomonas citri pv. citri TaxID=611301 RepID=A0A0U5FM29_XANCI|nr:hypothetical protein HZS92_00432 [Xanthomonas citri pv. citri]QYF43184.1 hypothetical protein HZS93_00431 [Xanthomonas citri]CEE15918.1 hypothetical protein XAC3824_120057 [Xanthomonas citri pv. citri]CEE17320.1 hypothetical protein XAC1083_110058 [Xanthomonas citri pv. citri]CEE21110.1 hypothetical protein XAC902_110057 [Xanthomonas citri pv. citri]